MAVTEEDFRRWFEANQNLNAQRRARLENKPKRKKRKRQTKKQLTRAEKSKAEHEKLKEKMRKAGNQRKKLVKECERIENVQLASYAEKGKAESKCAKRLKRRLAELEADVEQLDAAFVEPRARLDLLVACEKNELKNSLVLDHLPQELWDKITENLAETKDLFPLAMTCRRFCELKTAYLERARAAKKERGRGQVEAKFETKLMHKLHRRQMIGGMSCTKWTQGCQVSAAYLKMCYENNKERAKQEKAEMARLDEDRRMGRLSHNEYWFRQPPQRARKMNHHITGLAAREGHLDLLQELARDDDCDWDKRDLLASAAFGGQTAVLEWIKEKKWLPASRNYSFYMDFHDTGGCDAAAQSGRLKILQWLRDNECRWNEHTLAHAAHGNHREVIAWMRNQGLNWNSRATVAAAEEGHLELLEWMVKEGCPFNPTKCLERARKNDHARVAQWISSSSGERGRGAAETTIPAPFPGRLLAPVGPR